MSRTTHKGFSNELPTNVLFLSETGPTDTTIKESSNSLIAYIHHLFECNYADIRENLHKVADNVTSLIPQSETEFQIVTKFGLYPAEECQPFITKRGTPFYELDNMALMDLRLLATNG